MFEVSRGIWTVVGRRSKHDLAFGKKAEIFQFIN
jgi:hypothetical protein